MKILKTIDLIPFDCKLRVLITTGKDDLLKEYPKGRFNDADNMDGIFFAEYDKKKKYYFNIGFFKDSLKNYKRREKIGLIAHEVYHCVYHLFNFYGAGREEESAANYMQFLVTEIVTCLHQ